MTFVYRKLKIEKINVISHELRQFVLPYDESKDNVTGLWALDLERFKNTCPHAVNYFNSIGQLDNIYKVCIIIVHPPSDGKKPHVDNLHYTPLNTGPSKGCLSLNFNIENCIDTSVMHYKYISGDTKVFPLHDPTQGSFIVFQGCKMEEIARYNLEEPVIMNNSTPHCIVNLTNAPRISLSFRFKDDPWDFAKHGI
jgi:hypothetical protein